MRVVLDTNVLVSGLIAPQGTCGHILRMVFAGHIRPCVDERMMQECRAVLARPKFGFRAEEAEELLILLRLEGVRVTPPALPVRLPDRSDEPFLEVAAAESAVLVTGNVRHYPPHLRCGVKVMTPAEFAASYSG